MVELPLFPLNLVLFPMQSLALHVFEQRYRQLVSDCLTTDSPFGIVLLESGAAEEGRSRVAAVPRLTGTTATIVQTQALTDGRMNLLVVGRERFRVLEFDRSKPYLTGLVELSPLPSDGLTSYARHGLQRCVARYLQVLEKAGRVQPAARKLPAHPLMLASLAAVLLHDISADQRQQLLEAEDLAGMYDDLRAVYRREIVLLETMLTEPDDTALAPFSPN
jgi:uncharacterized protein